MGNELYNSMLVGYDLTTVQNRRNALFEVNQQIILAGLYNGGFFDEVAFYGGTCLRIFHNLQRFSEDLDFSLLAPNADFDFSNYFHPIIDAFALVGRDVEIQQKQKSGFPPIESAFLKDNTEVFDLVFRTERAIKIKIEIDTLPPSHFATERKLLLHPYSFWVNCFTLPNLFAGKMHALLFRSWKNRVKGRDWYDFEWYVRNNVPLAFTHFAERVWQFNQLTLTHDHFRNLLRQKMATTDISQAKADILPFVKNPKELDIWSNDYFLQLVDLLKII